MKIFTPFLFLSILVFTSCFSGFSQTTAIPDSNFEDVLEAYGMGDGIPNNHLVTTANIDQVTFLDVALRDIADLTGIEAFTALTYLDCSHNDLISLDVSANTALTYLNCSFNYSLTTLNVSANKSLSSLYCNNSSLTSLDVSGDTALTFLNCSYSSITSLVSANRSLNYLVCSSNLIITLDVSANTALTYLDCEDNSLTNIDISSNTALEVLNCSHNDLTGLDVSANTVLQNLICSFNSLTTLDLSGNTALEYLNCGNNSLTTINVSANTALKSLECENISALGLDVSSNTALEDLDCGNNSLTTLDVSANTALIALRCYNNNLNALTVSANTLLKLLFCNGNNLTTLDVSSNTALTQLSCSSNSLIALNVNNGNNTSILFYDFVAYNNPNLTCIEVDDSVYSASNWTNVDPWASFSENCNYCIPAYTNLADTICRGDSLLFGSNYLDSTGTYMDTLLTAEGCDSIISIELVVEPAHTISLGAGWNMISSYVQPDNPNMPDVFTGIANNIAIVKNNIGETYVPSLGINTIGDWKVEEGYLVKSAIQTQLNMGCDVVDPQSTPISLKKGENLVAYLRTSPMPIDIALSSIASELIIVKDILGNAYIPSLGINGIGDMLPGQGYKIKLANPSILIYPSN